MTFKVTCKILSVIVILDMCLFSLAYMMVLLSIHDGDICLEIGYEDIDVNVHTCNAYAPDVAVNSLCSFAFSHIPDPHYASVGSGRGLLSVLCKVE